MSHKNTMTMYVHACLCACAYGMDDSKTNLLFRMNISNPM